MKSEELKKKKKKKNKKEKDDLLPVIEKTTYEMKEKMGIFQIVYDLQMDVSNQISSLEEILMINPFQKKSHRLARLIASTWHFNTNIYPKQIATVETAVKVPKVIFFPTK
jgi:hypothetical protein